MDFGKGYHQELIQKIALVGAESTGKTTLAKILAKQLCAPFVPEFVRLWVNEHQKLPTLQDVKAVVEGQIAIEEQLAKQKSSFLVCDTNPLVNYVLIKHYLAEVPLWIEQEARYRKYDFVFLTLPDFPWQPDGLQRDSAAVQAKLHQDFVATLADFGIPHTPLAGDINQRIKTISETIGVKLNPVFQGRVDSC